MIEEKLVWLEQHPDRDPLVIDQSPSPVNKAIFSKDGRVVAVLRKDGSLRVVSFDAEKLIESMVQRVAPLASQN